MKKSIAILSGVLALGLAAAPAAFAVQGAAQPAAAAAAAADIEQTNAAAPSVQQSGNVTVADSTTTADGTTVSTSAHVDGVDSSTLEVFVTGTTDITSDASTADSEGQLKANAAIAEAQTTGNTVASMIATNESLETVSGLSAASDVVTTEFYVGIQNPETGEAYDGEVTVVLSLASEDDVNDVYMVLYYDAARGMWISIPFAKSGSNIILTTRYTGVYRFVSRVR